MYLSMHNKSTLKEINTDNERSHISYITNWALAKYYHDLINCLQTCDSQ